MLNLNKELDYDTLMDDNQKSIHEHFSSNSYLSNPDHVKKVMEWVTYWRRNPARFVQYYFGVTLHLYQCIILHMMFMSNNTCITASRSTAKSFIVAVYACAKCVLYRDSRVVIASATKGQARLIVAEKIKKEILPNSPLLNEEISGFKDSANDIEISFKNGSSIIVVTSNENARGYRSTDLILEEFRMIPQYIINSVLSPFVVIRQAPFIYKPEYSDLAEEGRQIYISSAWYQKHWMWDLIKQYTNSMLNDGKDVVIAMDYSIAIKHKIKTREFMQSEKKKLDSMTWDMEYENQMIRENTHAYFSYDTLNKNRVLKRPFYPRKNEDALARIKNKYTIPRQQGEIRIIACDIAPEGGAGNDNSIFSCIRALPETKEYKVSDASGEHVQISQGYRRQLVYMEYEEEFETTKQAIRIKQLFSDFDADYCVLDTRNAGKLNGMPLCKGNLHSKARKKSGTLKCQPEWKDVCKNSFTCNAYGLNLCFAEYNIRTSPRCLN